MTNLTELPAIPAGFTSMFAITVDDSDNEAVFADGPSVTAGTVRISSYWSDVEGLDFVIENQRTGADSGIFARSDLEKLPKLIEDLLRKIDQAHAVKVMTANPVPRANPEHHTVTEIAVWCDTHKIDAVAGFAAFTELHGAEYGIGDNNA